MGFDILNDQIIYTITEFLLLPDIFSLNETCKLLNEITDSQQIYKCHHKYVYDFMKKAMPKFKLTSKINKPHNTSVITRSKYQALTIWSTYHNHVKDSLNTHIQSYYDLKMKNDLYLGVINALKKGSKSAHLHGNMMSCSHSKLVLLFKYSQYNPVHILSHKQIVLPYLCNLCHQQCLGNIFICACCPSYTHLSNPYPPQIKNKKIIDTLNDQTDMINNIRNMSKYIYCSNQCIQQSGQHYNHPIKELYCIPKYEIPHKYTAGCLYCGFACVISVLTLKQYPKLSINPVDNQLDPEYMTKGLYSQQNKSTISKPNVPLVEVEFLCVNHESHLRNKLQSDSGRNNLLSSLSSQDIVYS